MSGKSSRPQESSLLSQLRKRRFKIDIVVVFCALIIPTVIVISTFTYFKTVDATMKIANSLIEKVTGAVIEKTTNYLKPAQVLSQIAPQIIKNPYMKVEFDSELEEFFVEVINLQPQIDLFYYGTESGSFLQAYQLVDGEPVSSKWIDRDADSPLVRFKHRNAAGQIVKETTSTDIDYDPRERPWYKGAKEKGALFWTDLYVFYESRKPGITVASPVYRNGGNLVGVVAADITLDGISTFLRNLDVSRNGLVFIIDQNNRFVAFPDSDRMVEIRDGEVLPVRASDLEEKWIADGVRRFEDSGQQSFTYRSGGENYFARFTPFPASFGKEWTIAVLIPENDFLGGVRKTSRTIIMISLGILAVAIMFGLVFARNISRPIEQLTEELRLIRDFDLNGRKPVTSYIREIQTMANAVESMKNGLKAFRRFVPAALVQQLIASGEQVVPGGKEREVTLFFSDIAGFTSISEQLPARELMVGLSEYFEEMTQPISEERGTVDKYIGDAVMAFWGAPQTDEQHALHACRAALKCQRAIARLNGRRSEQGDPPLLTRIGVHTGFTIIGNMGSSERLNYTALGDNVNLASRLEGANKRYGTSIIISQATYRYVRNDFILRPLDLVAVKGKSNSVQIYELMGDVGSNDYDALQQLAESFHKVFDLYLKRQWSQALAILQELQTRFPDDRPTAIYIERCRSFMANEPGAEWSGVVRMEQVDPDAPTTT